MCLARAIVVRNGLSSSLAPAPAICAMLLGSVRVTITPFWQAAVASADGSLLRTRFTFSWCWVRSTKVGAKAVRNAKRELDVTVRSQSVALLR